jgi:hypothetical protein
MNFKTWQELKKVKEQDMVFARALSNPVHVGVFQRLADKMSAFEPTFSEGLALLETGTELILMGHDETLFSESQDLNTWKLSLQRLRYPHTMARDDEARQQFEKLPWPYGSKIKFERRGDKAGVELKVFVSTSTDLTKIIAGLERVQMELAK